MDRKEIIMKLTPAILKTEPEKYISEASIGNLYNDLNSRLSKNNIDLELTLICAECGRI